MRLKYVVVFEQTPNNYSAYLPDLPGCTSTGKTWEEMQEMIREAVTGHIEVMLEHGDPLPDRAMSLEEAIAYHSEPLTEYEKKTLAEFGGCEDFPDLPPVFEIIEFEVNLPQPDKVG